MTDRFLPGLDLSRRFYAEAVRPLLRLHLPDSAHSAARLGGGSEVLGLDTPRSADHEWGPRLEVFLEPGAAREHGTRLTRVLADELPKRFLGHPTHFASFPDEPDTGVMADTDGPVSHRVTVTSVGAWFHGQLGFDPLDGVTTLDWLATPTQRLAEQTAGAVFHDGLGRLAGARRRLAWYPDDVWRYALAAQWQRIAQEEAFVGRTGEVGDEAGSAVVAARLVRDLMRLAFLLERVWAPYSKWLGSAFARLVLAGTLGRPLRDALAARSWKARERALSAAYETAADAQNRLGLCEPVDPSVRRFFGRPFLVLDAGRLAAALRRGIGDPALRARPLVGAVDQFVDSTDVLSHPARFRAAARAVHEA